MVYGLSARERVSINKAVDNLSPIEKEHMFTILEEKLDYPSKLEEYVRKKAVNTRDWNLATVVQGTFKKKICEQSRDSLCEACRSTAIRLGHVCAGNQLSFISAIEPGDKTKESIA
jgi:hypothetical protein